MHCDFEILFMNSNEFYDYLATLEVRFDHDCNQYLIITEAYPYCSSEVQSLRSPRKEKDKPLETLY